jgi:hypothetical protein
MYWSGVKMKSEQREKALQLRLNGLSIKTIAKQLNVSKGSVSIWVRDIKLTTEQIEKLQNQNPIFNRQINGAKSRSDKARKIRLQYQQEGRLKAKEKNQLHQMGCMLYWAEGTKSKNNCTLVNSDVNLLKLYIRFLRECFYLDNNQFTITINCYTNNGFSKEKIEDYWINELQLDRSVLRKGQENNRPRSSTNAIRHNKLLYGLCCITVKSSTKIIQHIYGAIQEYASFNNNYMLM